MLTEQHKFTSGAWAAATDIRQAIDEHPFLLALQDGNLDRSVFGGYLAQDAHYLVGFARALSMCAAQAATADDIAFWASSAQEAILVERSLHARHVADLDAVEPSPTTAAYLAFLMRAAAAGCYPVLAAAVLPCFWIYHDVGRRFSAEVDLTGHPYADWISTYGEPDFAVATERVKLIVDTQADEGSADLRRRMLDAFLVAARYEWMFFEAAWRSDAEPAPALANGHARTTATTKDAMDADSQT